MKKKRRLKKWVKEVLVIAVLSIIFSLLMCEVVNQYEKTGEQCDNYYGRTCSLYELEQYGKGIRR